MDNPTTDGQPTRVAISLHNSKDRKNTDNKPPRHQSHNITPPTMTPSTSLEQPSGLK